MKVLIGWSNSTNPFEAYFNSETQTKKFKDEMAAIEWCRKNWKHITHINHNPTASKQLSHFDIIRRIRRPNV